MRVNRSEAPAFRIPDQINLMPPEHRTLAGGIPLYYMPSPSIEAVKIELIFPVHYSKAVLEKPLLPFFMLHMVLEGTTELPSEALDDFFDFHGSEVEVISGYERQGLSLLTTRKHLEKVLPVFRSLFTSATFPEKSLARKKSQKKLSIGIQREQTSARANQLIRAALAGKSHPFGYQATENDVDAISREDLLEYYSFGFLSRPQLFVTGNLPEDSISTIAKSFEDLPLIVPKNDYFPVSRTARHREVEKKDGALQSSIRMGKWMVPMAHPDFPALSVFNTFLGGYFGSRLIKNIREEKGYTYGINSFLSNLYGSNYWMVAAEVKGGHGAEVIEEVYREIELLTRKPIPEEEIEIVRNYLSGALLANFSSPFDLMGHFQQVHFQGLDLSHFSRQLDFIKNFEEKDLKATAGKYFEAGEMQEIIAGMV
ncbi:Predicted Zn-dependent peptidase [Cyclobacterium lianum]|uniref:Predicted Zn-dependent peptidase n=1 Tax=Cyclobacterium lianum TaxID=388280 RepID=A0A1M7PWY2_9BACT|nr:pitrilysin family protein [Cyclobacterium lianum]SHN22111.1 Predicted Zn-dependent peptidase [Cyclobacterium lianum]